MIFSWFIFVNCVLIIFYHFLTKSHLRVYLPSPAIRHFGRSVKTAHLSLKSLTTHNTFLIVQKHFPERPFVKCRTLKKIILNVAEHFLHHRTTSYRALYTNNYTFGIFCIIFYLTIHQKYNNLMYVRRIFCSRPATNKAETQQRFHNSSLI